ncbi:MAG: ABC transporter permease [Firmicutes bacterium]|nr:ABC transporter permease [Bacillota bacterium]
MNIKRLGRFASPYMVWLIILVVFPLLMMILLSFMKTTAMSFTNATFSFESWNKLFTDSAIRTALANSFRYAFLATVIAFFLGYPMAYILAKSPFSNKLVILVLTIIPMWSNSLLRTSALANLLSADSIVNDLLNLIGLSFVWNIRGTGLAIVVGLVITYLPFMILPIYTVLEKMDPLLHEASMDLGSNKAKTFLKVTFPLSLKGVATGIILVFLPSFSGFAIPEILGNSRIIFIGTLVDSSFLFSNYNYGSLLSLVIIILILGSMFLFNKVDKEGETLL